VEIFKRFEASKVLAKKTLERGNYRKPPTSQIGWIVRIACTAAGQGAWLEAKDQIKKNSITDESQNLTIQAPSTECSCEKDSEPGPGLSPPESTQI